MPFGWLAGLVGIRRGGAGGGGGGRRVGIRRKAAPRAQRELAAEVATSALPIRRAWVRRLPPAADGAPAGRAVIVRVDSRGRPDVAAWLGVPSRRAVARAVPGGEAPAGAEAGSESGRVPGPGVAPALGGAADRGGMPAHGDAPDLDGLAGPEAPAADLDGGTPRIPAPAAPSSGPDATACGPSATAGRDGGTDRRPAPRVATTWLLLAHADEAVLLGVVDRPGPVPAEPDCRFALRFRADADRCCLEALAGGDPLLLIAEPVRWRADGRLATPHAVVPYDPTPLGPFLRDRPVAVV